MSSVRSDELKQFDVVPHPGRQSRANRPYLVIIQADRYSHVRTRLVAPLIVANALTPFDRLTPEFEINGKKLRLLPLDIAQIPLALLKRPVANLSDHRMRIIEAFDLVITGI